MRKPARIAVICSVIAFSSLSTMESLAQVVLFQDDFEDGKADGWEMGAGWQVEIQDNNYVLSGTDHHFAYPYVDGWSDYIIEARVRILNGGFHFNFRESGETGHIRYFLGLSEGGSRLSKQISSDLFDLTGLEPAVGRDNWHTVKIILEGPNIKIYMDGALSLDYTDTDNPILFGRFSFETHDDSHIHLDDVIVTDLSQPEVICGSDTASEGSLFSLDVNLVQNAARVAGFQFDLTYDASLLQATDVTYGDFLSGDGDAAYCNESTIDNTEGKIRGILSARTGKGGLRGGGILATITFKAVHAGESAIDLQNVKLCDTGGRGIEATIASGSVNIHVKIEGDVNSDGIVDISDLIIVGRHFGETPPTDANADVNGDGTVDILDLILAGKHFGESVQKDKPRT